MTNKEILQSNLLDILFENRNKSYGAYTLRKNYNYRLGCALAISLTLPLLLFFWFVKNGNTDYSDQLKKPDINLTQVDFSCEKQKEHMQPQQHSGSNKVVERQTRYTAFRIVPEVNHHDIPTNPEIENANISNANSNGIPGGNSENFPGKNIINENKNDPGDKLQKLTQSEAQFPGGKTAFAAFLNKYLISPDELEPGEKKTVLVRFKVDVDGSISQTEIIQSGGSKFDNEVIRVLKKMPKWIPAQQNGVKVVAWFTQPVTFISPEQ
jgi:protein TonB